jgi:hypothetical protein
MSKCTSGENSQPIDADRIAALRAAFVHLRLALDGLERALVGSSDARESGALPLPEREVMKPGEYADRVRVSVRKVHRWIERGLPHFAIEGRVRIRVKEADAWLAEQEATPAEGEAK